MRGLVMISLFLLLAATTVAGVEKAGGTSAGPTVAPVDPASLKKLVAGFKGKVVAVNFWATWCTPCVEEFPDLLRLRNTYQGKGFEFIFVSLDNPKKALPQVAEFLRGKRVDFPTYIKQTGDDEAFINSVDKAWSGAIPATFMYDRQGRLTHTIVDERTFEQLEALVLPLLKR